MGSRKSGYKSKRLGNKIDILRSTKFPDVLVVTPLLEFDFVSKDTRKTIKRNKLKYLWISSQGNHNIPTNAQEGLLWAKENVRPMPKYYIMIDNDIVLGRSMLDRLFKSLEKSEDDIGYAYAGFEYKGTTNMKFPADPFEPERLMKANYISSNSMFKIDVVDEVGLVTNDKYKRLLDWAFLLKCLAKGYHGLNVPNARFVAVSEPGDVSSGSHNDYWTKHAKVYKDFVQPMII